MTTTVLRPARPDDTPLILDMIRGLARYEKLEHEVEADVETLRAQLFGEVPGAEVIFACREMGEGPETPGGLEDVGFALFFHTFSTFRGRRGLYLEDLFVRPEHRGQGHGLALLRHLARLAVERDCARFEWVVLDWNQPAIDLYRGIGARPLADWSTFRLEDEALAALAAQADATMVSGGSRR
ncbi:MAG: GNAT family N-acetyltransferase [Acidobacteriota bacterium]